MIEKYICLVAIITLFSCQNLKENEDDGKSLQSFYNVQGKRMGELDVFVFNGSLKDWIRVGSHEGYFFPLNITSGEEDSISDVYLEYNMGVYLIHSSKLGLKVRVPLFPESNIQNNYPCKPSEVFNYYRNEFRNNLMFRGRDSYLECRYKLLNNEEGVYQVFHEEIYQPNFETAPVITGLRLFTISLKEGVIEFETLDDFDYAWY